MHLLNVVNYSYGRPLGVIIPDGALWKEQRRFVGRSLKMLGGDLGEGMEVWDFSFPFIFVFGEEGFLLLFFLGEGGRRG